MEHFVSDQELEQLRRKCRSRLKISAVLAAAVYLALLCFLVWSFFLGDPELRARIDAPLAEKAVTILAGP